MIRQIVQGLKARAQPGYQPPHYRDPRAYWERRHREAGATLEGVGLCGLGPEGNIADYECKWEHIGPVLQQLGPGPTKSLLDAGCGIGWFSARAASLGFKVEGVDFSAAAIATAQRVAGSDIRWHTSELRHFRLARLYDVVMCIDVLFHIVDDQLWRETVENLASRTGASGHLVIQEQLVTERVAVADTTRTHVRRRTEEDYRTVLSGWQLLQRHSYRLPAQGSEKDLLLFSRVRAP